MEIPTNLPIKRIDADDEVYRTVDEKNDAIITLIEDCQKRGQPVLVGTTSIEKSEDLSALLKKRKFKHNVLNARYHEQEASIVAQAGVSGTVTIATNMAGRGTDIQLGGNADMRIRNELGSIVDQEEFAKRAAQIRAEVAADKEKVIAAGGMYIVGTERHESRRIDNQLRGRSGRQGDPGASKFFLSLQDDLMRIFGSERMDSVLTRLGLEKGEAITHPWVNKALEKAQQKVEARNFEIRKNILKYDNVLNDQRKVIFEQRKEIMSADDVSAEIADYRAEVVDELVNRHIPPKAYAEQWDAKGLQEEIERIFSINLPVVDWTHEEGIADEEVRERITKTVENRSAERTANFGPEIMRYAEKAVLLQTLDHNWREHIINLDHLRQYVGLRGYGQRDPLIEYKAEAYKIFDELMVNIKTEICHNIFRSASSLMAFENFLRNVPQQTMHQSTSAFGGGAAAGPSKAGGSKPGAASDIVSEAAAAVEKARPVRSGPKVGRNDPCPCGSGKKYKHCCGK
jgi:preprotein translocase subunit SecA